MRLKILTILRGSNFEVINIITLLPKEQFVDFERISLKSYYF